MSEPVRVWKPECDPGWKCNDHGLDTLNTSVFGLLRRAAGGPEFASMDEAVTYFNALPESEGFKLLESTSDVNPCINCQQVDTGLKRLLGVSQE